MATYKVIQDVEAEDKILGPLTLRQFIYAGIAAICLYLSYLVLTHGVGFMAAVFIPIALVGIFFAIPWNRDQPTEVWALARIRFLVKPQRRIWNQSGVKELVTVTAPKKENINYTDGLSQTEVKSRLHALADTLDSRGWAVKNSAVNLYTQPALVMSAPDQERLVGISDMPQQVTPIDIHDSDDMLDEQNNAAAQQMDNMIAVSAKAHRQKIIDTLNEPEPQPAPKAPAQQAPANNYWFLNQPSQSAHIPDDMVTFNTQVVSPHMDQATPEQGGIAAGAPNEHELVQQLEAHKQQLPMSAYYGHLHTIQPLSAQGQTPPQMPAGPQQAAPDTAAQAAPHAPYGISSLPATDIPAQTEQQPNPDSQAADQNNPANTAAEPVTPAHQAAILKQLASNDDLNVATLAREAHRSELVDGEVVIKLH